MEAVSSPEDDTTRSLRLNCARSCAFGTTLSVRSGQSTPHHIFLLCLGSFRLDGLKTKYNNDREERMRAAQEAAMRAYQERSQDL